ncbi:MAG TPA: BON domain-containing protein [Fluviicoccus sp.]|nr:BON domain-containing protein [Fluviicoccus sp.]
MSTQLSRRPAVIAVLIGSLTLAACSSTQTAERSGAYIDDTVITTQVKAAVFQDPGLRSAEINVETYKGDVQLSGFVSSQADIDRAMQLAQGVKGVHKVTNGMRVK